MNTLSVTSVGLLKKDNISFKSKNTFLPVVSQPVQAPQAPPVKQSSSDNNKNLSMVSAALAVVSLGVATYVSVRKPKGLTNLEKSFNSFVESAKENNKLISNLAETLTKNISENKALKNEIQNINNRINTVEHNVNGLSAIKALPNAAKNFFSRVVEVNGKHLELATVLNGYGHKEKALSQTLRAESTRRVLGAIKPIELPDKAMIRVPTAEYAGFAKTGGLAIVPKELVANLGAVINNKQRVDLIVDTPLYLGQVENSRFFDIKRVANKYQYVSTVADKNPTVMANLNKIDEMHIPIYTDHGKSYEKVEVFMSDEMRSAVDYTDTLKQFDDETAQAIQKAMAEGNVYDTNLVTFVPSKEVGALPTAEVKYRTVFYKNDKFRMDGPVQDDAVKNIYNDHTTQAGETERNIYFGKYFYENLILSAESSRVPLRADMIMGNDWHTGPIAAMLRQLTPARKAMGLEPGLADKIQNTPMVTIMHNFKLQGQAWHSQEKFMNIMFGEHAAKIVENSWMPQNADFPAHLMNGLFSGHGVNPQTMAMAYADDIVFVSRGNFNEAANNAAMGGTNYALAALRGRTGKYADVNELEKIAMASGIKPNEISQYPTAKGITNGCDRVNNIITENKARWLETTLGLKPGSVKSDAEAILKPYETHQHNKKVYLEKLIADIDAVKKSGGKDNAIKLKAWETTDLTGVDENTLIHGMAGRLVDQKGIDIWANAIEKYYERGNYDKNNPPVFYLQGIGDQKFIERFLEVKEKVAQIDPKAANRMVFAGLFSEPERYAGFKMMTDFAAMPSWDEPCGLVHKEIAYHSGAISIVNKKGGLTDGLIEYNKSGVSKGANSIFVDFKDKDTNKYEDALAYNAEKTADAFELAQKIYSDKVAFAEGIKSSYSARYDWLRGKVQEYVEIGKRHGVFKDSIDSNY